MRRLRHVRGRYGRQAGGYAAGAGQSGHREPGVFAAGQGSANALGSAPSSARLNENSGDNTATRDPWRRCPPATKAISRRDPGYLIPLTTARRCNSAVNRRSHALHQTDGPQPAPPGCRSGLADRQIVVRSWLATISWVRIFIFASFWRSPNAIDLKGKYLL